MEDYPRISDAQYKKLMFQLRSQTSAILNVFRCYGMQADVDLAVEECITLTENFAMTVRGKNSPIHILKEPKRRNTE